jgi:hypothetical protein
MFVCPLEALVVASALFDQLHHSRPVAEPHAQIQCQVLPINIFVYLLCLVISFEISGNLCLLFKLFVQVLQFVNEQDAVVVFVFDESAFCDLEIEFVE